uniref:Capping protein regulator and myosin 1 linker 2 n=1 Tax=Labrus bergylta TaxID=56723 RepID=A0A3Q3EGF7_9LABR
MVSRKIISESQSKIVLSVFSRSVHVCVQVENTFSYLEIRSINIHSLTEIVLEAERQTLSFSVLHGEDLESMVSHITASLKRTFPDSSPLNLLKTVPPDMQQRLIEQTGVIEEQLHNQPGPCEALYNKQMQTLKQSLLSCHLESRDLALAVAAQSFSHWFSKIYCKELKLSVDVQQQLTFLLSRSSCLEELSLEACGLKPDFAVKIAAALRENTSSKLQSINLSGNPIEDKGLIAVSQEFGNLPEGLKYISLSRVSVTARGVGCLSQMLSSTLLFSSTLSHLDLSGNPGSLVTEDAMFLFKFLSSTNSLCHLDLSDTSCPLDTLFVSLSAGCCYKLMHLNLARNPFSHRKVREVTKSIQKFFSQSCELKYVNLSATKLPPQALRLLLQGLATNTYLIGLELDISSCELRSTGAQVIQEHISEATVIKSLDISDNGFENDMVTLVLSVGRCRCLQHLALGRNFAMKSRALTDVLHRIAQLIQDEECPLQSLSLCDSRLKTGINILLSALGGHAALAEVDISGNSIGDTGAKMLAKALMSNTRLRRLAWDRNSVTARGFKDVADALEWNFTLQQVCLPLADITQSYRSDPDRTSEALHKYCTLNFSETILLCYIFCFVLYLQLCLFPCVQFIQRVNHCDTQQVQADILNAYEVLHNSRESIKLLPSLYEAGRTCTSDGDMVNCILNDAATALTNEFNRSIQELAQGLTRSAEAVCPRVVQRSSVSESLSECVSKKVRQTHTFLTSTLLKHTGPIITNRLSELKKTLSVSLAESIIEQVLQDLTTSQDKMGLDSPYFPSFLPLSFFYPPSFCLPSHRSCYSLSGLLDADWEQQMRDRAGEPSPSTSPGASLIPSRGLPLFYSISARAPEKEAAGHGGLFRREASSPGPLPGSGSPASPMEPLPTQGQTLRHYTASRPRPRRTHTQPPSFRPQEPVSKVENEASEGMGRVDEGVEEFFTKKIIPDYALTTVTSPSVPSIDTSFIPTDVPPLSSSSPTPPTPASDTTTNLTTLPSKNIKKKFGDFFAFKRARAGRAAKAGGGEGGGEGVKVKRTSIADLIRPLREAKEREREREREKGRGSRSVEDANVSNDAAITEGTAAIGERLAGDARGMMAPAKTLPTMTPPSETTPSYPTITTSPDLTHLEDEAAPALPHHAPSSVVTPPLTEQEMKMGGSPFGERRLKVTKRSLREGKSQSLILLTGLEPEDKEDIHSKKHASESTSSFEQRLQVMLHRMGVVKTPPADTKTSQVGCAILEKPEPPPTFLKPRTMSTSSGKDAASVEPVVMTRDSTWTGAFTVLENGRWRQSLPKPRQHIKPLPQRRAVSVHEDSKVLCPLSPSELKAVLQRSPIRFRGNMGDLTTCTEDPSSGEGAQRAQEGKTASEPLEVSPQSHKEKSPGSGDLRKSTQERGEAVSKQHTVKAEPADQRTEPPLSEKHKD